MVKSFRIAHGRVASTYSISLLPKHVPMLEELENSTGKSRSLLFQEFLERAYKELIEKMKQEEHKT
jgi:hypothetical protein